MITIGIQNQKGGTGKSTLTFFLAKILASRGFSILAIDNDPQGNLSANCLEDPSQLVSTSLDLYEPSTEMIMPVRVCDNLDLIGADITLAKIQEGSFKVVFRFKESLEAIADKYDICLIDNLPSFGYLHMASLTASNYIMIPTELSHNALKGMSDLINSISETKKHMNQGLKILGVVINSVDGRRPLVERDILAYLEEAYGDLLFHTQIMRRVKVKEATALHKSITEYEPAGDSAARLNALVDEVLERLGGAQ